MLVCILTLEPQWLFPGGLAEGAGASEMGLRDPPNRRRC